jgi:hypothetical protein
MPWTCRGATAVGWEGTVDERQHPYVRFSLLVLHRKYTSCMIVRIFNDDLDLANLA